MILAIYLIGVVVCYIAMKWSYKRFTGLEWTRGMRVLVIIYSFSSWLGVAAVLILELIGLAIRNEKPTKW